MSSDRTSRLVEALPASAGSRGELAFWLCHAAFWSIAFAASLVVSAVCRPVTPHSWPFLAGRIGLCFLATAAMRWLSKQPVVLARLNVSKIGLVAGGAISSAVVITLLLAGLDWLLMPGPAGLGKLELIARLAINLTLLANWCALYFGYQLIRERNSAEFRAMEAESLALRNELDRLQAQISPHFLFNALNTVMACRDDPEAIDTVTQALANYLRFLLRPAAALEPLAREIDALEEYLTVQSARFGDALATRIECDTDVRRVPVPPVMIQPLVENAIKYGIASGNRPVQVVVSAHREADWLVVEVANSGRWAPAVLRQSTGTGLSSLARRLKLVVGPSATLTHTEADGWVRVRIRMPAAHHPPEGIDATATTMEHTTA
ncbi:MAG: sensor histidine kinase [Planctomycetaceae bacterium]